MIKAVLIPTENVEQCWTLVDKHIANALARSGNHYESNDIKENCLNNKMQLWLGWNNDEENGHYFTVNDSFREMVDGVVGDLSM